MQDLGYPEVTPERVAVHSLEECLSHLEQVRQDNLFIISAACSAHRALQAALTAALAGSANIGASPPKVQKRWLEHFEIEPSKRPHTSPGFRVMGLLDLLKTATISKLPWSQTPLPISSCESFFALRLTNYRDDFEHPKQLTYVLTNREVAWSILFTAPLVQKALYEIGHRIDEHIPRIKALTANIIKECQQIELNELDSRVSLP